MRKWILPASLMFMLAACTVDLPSNAPAIPMTVIEARQNIHGLANPQGGYFIKDDHGTIYPGRNTYPLLRHDALSFGNVEIPFQRIGAMSVTYTDQGTSSAMEIMSIRLDPADHPQVIQIHQRDDLPHMRTEWLASALLVLKQAAANSSAEQAAFEQAASAYRNADPKPALPESVRQREVQAEELVRNKEFPRAAEAYRLALKETPAWPQGHFNFALVLESLKDYELAIEEMQRYLALVPDASNARAAQDKIYQWQSHLPADNAR